MTDRRFSTLDRLFGHLDQALHTVFGPTPYAARANPAGLQNDTGLTSQEQELAGRLMRINHAGEICAQALYQGQAVTAKLPQVREKMEQAAQEENDHLAWTQQRIDELGTHTSYLNFLWYSGSFALGAIAGVAGDKWSLGFVAETERQVVEHLNGHLQKLPATDNKSRAILEQMRQDENNHATQAMEAGAASLPRPIKKLMWFTSKIMTRTAYWL